MSKADHFVADITQKAILEYQGKVLVTSGDGEWWELPGGRLHWNEKPIDGLKREMQEELTITVEPLSILGVATFISSSGNSHFGVFYLCAPVTDINQIKINDGEVVDMRWIVESEVDDLNAWPQYKEVLHKFFRSRA
ncbi:MAG: NUDIX hydrolase [Patescibacteria group bacterium]|jgi:ADP-ribose pyrophosphatase YjhB (NUDIX family)